MCSVTIMANHQPSAGCKAPSAINQDQLHLLCSVCDLPVVNARQSSDCGCRICEDCYLIFKERKITSFECKRCKQSITTDNIFMDRAVFGEVKRASFPCCHEGCPWKGSNYSYRDHVKSCKFAIVKCSHPGCGATMQRLKLKDHTASCPYQPVVCRWCKRKVPATLKNSHELNECPEYKVSCPLGCDEKIARKMIPEHVKTSCKLQKHPCNYKKYGCNYEGNRSELDSHYASDSWKHLQLFEKTVHHSTVELSSATKKIEETDQNILAIGNGMSMLKTEVASNYFTLTNELMKMEKMLQSINEEYKELALTVQVLQATSYNGEFIWKIPEVSRRRDESIRGTTISLFSAPFYTSRFGYKLCLRLYMNGDGSGKGTHLSLFLTIMKGEYDSLLQWPFPCRVTMTLLDQKGKNHVYDCFKPDATSSSFWRPQSDMNIASGCPQFAPLTVLRDPKYVAEDAMYFKVTIDTSDIGQKNH